MHEGADGRRQRLLDGVAGNAALPVRLGDRQDDDRRLVRRFGPVRGQLDVLRLQCRAIAVHQIGAKAAFTTCWIAGVARKLVCRYARFAPRDSSRSQTS